MMRALKKLLFSSISIRLLSVLVGFGSTVLVNRALGLDLRGEYTTIYTYANLLQTVFSLGIAYAYVPLCREFGGSVAEKAVLTAIWGQFALCLLGSAVFLVFCFSISNLFICLIMSLLILNGQIVFIALIRNMRRRNLVLLASAIVYAGLNVGVLIAFSHDLAAVLICYAFKSVFEIMLCTSQQKLFVFDLRSLSMPIMRRMLSFGLPTALLSLLITLNYNIDVVVLNALHASDREIGIFGVAYTLSNMLWFIPDAFKEYVYSKSAREELGGTTFILICLNMCICAAICVVFLCLGRSFLELFYGSEYGAAFGTTLVVFVGIIPMVAFKLIHPLYVNAGRSGSVVLLLTVSIVMNAVIATFLIPHYGAFGAAVATVLAYSVCGALFLVKFIHDYRITFSDVKVSGQALLERLRG